MGGPVSPPLRDLGCQLSLRLKNGRLGMTPQQGMIETHAYAL